MIKNATDLENWLTQYYIDNNTTDKLCKISVAMGALDGLISLQDDKEISKSQIVSIIKKILEGEL